MAKMNGGGAEDGADVADAPLIDLNDANVKKLIARAKKRGYITYDQLNEALPQDQMSSDQLEDIMAALNEMGVNIVENEEAGEDGDEKEASEEDEAEVTEVDGDGTADFAGGFAAAAAMLGNAPELYHLDTSQPGAPRARRLAEEVARIVRGRLSNPRWIEGQMRHGFRGATEIAETIRNLYAYAALTNETESRDFEALYSATLADDRVRDFLISANPEAAAAIATLFRAAEQRGFWTSRRNS